MLYYPTVNQISFIVRQKLHDHQIYQPEITNNIMHYLKRSILMNVYLSGRRQVFRDVTDHFVDACYKTGASKKLNYHYPISSRTRSKTKIYWV